jgi:hypothetical protein
LLGVVVRWVVLSGTEPSHPGTEDKQVTRYGFQYVLHFHTEMSLVVLL